MNNATCLSYPKPNSRNSTGNVNRWHYGRKSIIARSLAFGRDVWKTEEKDIFDISSVFDKEYQKAKARVIGLFQNQNNEYALNNNVQKIALDLLRLLRNQKVVPSLINLTGDESLLFEFFNGANSFSLDIYNSGEIIFVVNIKNRLTHVYEFNHNQIKEVISKFTHTYE